MKKVNWELIVKNLSIGNLKRAMWHDSILGYKQPMNYTFR